MQITKNTRILIIGLGVIGGGYAMALSRLGYRVSCITLEQSDIDFAIQNGMIAEGTTEQDPLLIQSAQLIVFALYPKAFIGWIEEYGHLLREGTLITDVTGVKAEVVEKVQSMLPPGVEFIAAHPMAGRERSGVLYADDTVFQNANYIVTPTEKNTEEAIECCMQLGRMLGFRTVSTLSCREHDKMIAFLSQLTHVIAVTLMNANDTQGLEKYTGDSFRDLTRIAKINDRMWSELFLMNKEPLLAEMDAFMKEFLAFRALLISEDTDGMREKMKRSAKRRALFDK